MNHDYLAPDRASTSSPADCDANTSGAQTEPTATAPTSPAAADEPQTTSTPAPADGRTDKSTDGDGSAGQNLPSDDAGDDPEVPADESARDESDRSASNGDDRAVGDDFGTLSKVEVIYAGEIPRAATESDRGPDATDHPRQWARLKQVIVWEPGNVAQMVADVCPILSDSDAQIFVCNSKLVWVGQTGSINANGVSAVHVLTPQWLTLMLSALCTFLDVKTFEIIAVPVALIKAILAGPMWRFPALLRLVNIPALLPNGELIDRPGLHEASGIYYAPAPGLVIPAIPERPTLAQARAALALLMSLLVDALFADAAVDLAAALAAIITPLVRIAIDGCVPAFVFAAASSRIGKTELVQFISLILTGLRAKVQVPRSDVETEKRITAHVRAADDMIVFDNGTAPLGGESIEAARTSPRWTGRLFGTHDFFTGPLLATMYFTGNRVTYHVDMLGRVVVVNLKTDLEHVSERPLQRPDAQAWILAHRGELIAAALTVCRAYMAAGSPDLGLKPMRGFDRWSQVVRSALVWAGTADPLANLAELKSDADLETEAIGIALQELERVFPDEAHFTARAVFVALRNGLAASAVPGDPSPLADALKVFFDAEPVKLGPLKFGHKFAKLADRTVGGRHMKPVRRGNAGKEYKVFRPSQQPGTQERR